MVDRNLYLRIVIIICTVFIYNSLSAIKLIRRDGLQIQYRVNSKRICYSDDNARLRFIISKPISTCVVECALHGDCQLAQYQVRYHLCELFKSFDESQAVEKPGCLIVKKSDMDITQIPCTEDCQNGMSCDLDTKQCVHKDCEGVPLIEYGTIQGNINEIGSKTSLQCDNSDTVDVGVTRQVCQASGSWSIFTQTCTQTGNATFQCPASNTSYVDVLLSDGTMFTYRCVHNHSFRDNMFKENWTVHEITLNHSEAFDFCTHEGAHLIREFPDSKKEYLMSLTWNKCSNIYHESRYWIDGTNHAADNYSDITQWMTSTGEPLTTDFWRPGQPNVPWKHHCAYLLMSWTEHDSIICDWSCATPYYAICEK